MYSMLFMESRFSISKKSSINTDQRNHTRKYWEWHEAKRPNGQPLKRDHKNRSLNFTYSKLDIPKAYIRTEHQRGIYFTKLYENTNEFLCGKIEAKDLTNDSLKQIKIFENIIIENFNDQVDENILFTLFNII